MIETWRASLDAPAPGASVYDEAIDITGWVYASDHSIPLTVRAHLDGVCIASTRNRFYRADVCQYLRLSDKISTGFRMLGRISPPLTGPREATLSITASRDDEAPRLVASHEVRVVPAGLQERPYGAVVHPDNQTVLHREQIYGSGPPVEQPAIEIVDLLRAYLPEQASVVDVGCGAGAYGPALVTAGHQWLGLEADARCFEILQRRGLPFRRVSAESGDLPCGDSEWECAICIEVLEHVPNPDAFAGEIARITRRRALFSVPNIELLPYMHPLASVPWHILEADHKNFFTRASLRALLERHFRRVEVFSYCKHPVKTPDGIALDLHLFAIADK